MIRPTKWPEPPLCESPNGATVLLWTMSMLSETHYHDKWQRECEFHFWASVTGQPLARDVLEAREKYAIRWLAHQAGGWWHWIPNESGPSFLPMEMWEDLFLQWSGGKKRR